MAEPIYDKSSKWLLENHGKALAILAGLREVLSCRSVQSETVQPRQFPDGLLEVRLRGRSEPVLLLVEFCTYPESRVSEQMYDDIQLVRQAHGVLPDALALVLRRKGKMEVATAHEERSPLGLTGSGVRWTVKNLWEFNAEEMFAHPDIGIVPWVPLMSFDGPPEPLLRRCRERIEKEGGGEGEKLLVVTRALASLKFPHSGLLELFLRSEAMIETPMIRDVVNTARTKHSREYIERVIETRFGKLPDDARARLQGLKKEKTLDGLHSFAVVCPTLEEFVNRLTQETTPTPKPASSRRKAKP